MLSRPHHVLRSPLGYWSCPHHSEQKWIYFLARNGFLAHPGIFNRIDKTYHQVVTGEVKFQDFVFEVSVISKGSITSIFFPLFSLVGIINWCKTYIQQVWLQKLLRLHHIRGILHWINIIVRRFTFHCPNNAMGQTIRVPPFALDEIFIWESIFLFFVIWALSTVSVSSSSLSGHPLPRLASIRAIVITVFPSPIASANI